MHCEQWFATVPHAGGEGRAAQNMEVLHNMVETARTHGRRLALLAAAAIVGLAIGAGGAQAAVIFTEDFEDPANTQNWQVYQTFDSWNATSGAGIEIQQTGAVGGISAHDGVQYVELDSDISRGGLAAPTNSSMTRTVTLAAGNYLLEWYYLPRTSTPGDNIVEVYVDGASEALMTNLIGSEDGTNPPTTDWVQISYAFSVDGTDNDYGITFAAGGIENSLGGFIDSVTLSSVEVPEPGPLSLLAVAGLAGGFLARRRRAAAEA